MSENAFFPSQPEIQYRMNNYVEQKPLTEYFCQNIALYYQFNTQKGSINSFSLIPDGSIDLVFCCSPKKPEIFLWTSPFERSDSLRLSDECEYFGVRLFPEQAVLNLKYPMKELLNKRTPITDMIPKEDFLSEEKLIGKTFGEKISLFEEFINKKVTCDINYQSIVGYSIKEIYSCDGNINLGQLVKATGYSDRYIRKKFRESIGFSPKEFSEMVRFQKSLDTILEKENVFADVVFENGYYDQSHFINSFESFVNIPPTRYINYLA